MDSSQISARIKTLALAGGFSAAGIAGVRAEDLPELAYFEQWIARGRAGEMEYLKARDERGRLKRASLDRAAPWAKSVIVCAANYNPPAPYSTECNEPELAWISRYAWSGDYHEALLAKLRNVEAALQAEFVALEPRTWCYVDTGPLVERVYARHAGLGWIGKNTCILDQELGSFLFLGVILTSLELPPGLPAADRCGSCTACIDACPTQALVAPYELDPRRCIAYLTIEKRGEVPVEFRDGIGRHVFGCDICQDVCPWNRTSPRVPAEELGTRAELVNPALAWLAALTEDDFRQVFRGSPVKRTKFLGLQRNAAIAMGNSGRHEFIPALETMARGSDENLAEHARWALAKLGRGADGSHGARANALATNCSASSMCSETNSPE